VQTARSATAEVSSLVSELDTLAFDAWRAALVQELDGWHLRFNHGVTNRANSVWPNAMGGALSLQDRISRVEAFYTERGQAALYQLSPACRPDHLDQHLAGLGYQRISPVSIQVADCEEVESRTPESKQMTVEVSETLTEPWIEISAHRGRWSGDQLPVYRALLERAGGRTGFALVRREGQPVGVGFGVARSGWVGVFAMLTVPELRQRGVGAAVLSSLACWARGHGAKRMYLQVEQDNAPARALYARVGFAEVYCYHYRRAGATADR
jgi:GNAT superfamily N-acetyltransferase